MYAWRTTLLLMALSALFGHHLHARHYTLQVNAGQTTGQLERFWQTAMGSCHIYMTLNSVQGYNFKEHYSLASSELGIRMVRAHGVLNDDVGIYRDRNGQVSYNWSRLDSIYDYILSIGMKPFVELTFMPGDLASGSSTFGYYGGVPGNLSPPRDYTKWRNLCKAFAEHCQQRYGAEEIESWYWEIWNEPDISQFFSGNQNDYLRMYDYAVEGLTAANPNLKVGGPSAAVVGFGWIQALIDHCMTQNFANSSKSSVKLDFVSWHTYPGYLNNNADGNHMAASVKDVEAIIAQKKLQYPRLAVENILGEWNTTYKGGVSLHNEICASFVAKSIHTMFSDINGCPAPSAAAFWVISDIWEEWDVSSSTGFGPMGLILRERNVRKPPYLTFQMLNMMGDNRIAFSGDVTLADPGLNGFATINQEKTQVQILIYNHSRGNGETAPPVIDQVSLTVYDLPFEGPTLLTQRYGIDHIHNNSFTIWEQAGRPAFPSSAQWDAMEAAGSLKPIDPEKEIEFDDGACTLNFEQYQPGVSLVLLTAKQSTRRETSASAPVQKMPCTVRGGNVLRIDLGRNCAERTITICDLRGNTVTELPVADGVALWNRTANNHPVGSGRYLIHTTRGLAGHLMHLW